MTASSFPPSSRGGIARNDGFLKAETSRFFGRSEELDRIDEPFANARLVTIVGPSGIGKTRLALRYATTRQWQYGAVWFCDVREAHDAATLAAIVLRVLARDASAHVTDPEAAVTRALASRTNALVILDDVRPIAGAALRRWMAAAPNVRFVVTSREALDIASEHVVEIGGVTADAAIDMFVERVRSRIASWAPADGDLADIGELVRRLDGVPLAIELAAARVGAENPHALLALVSTRPPPSAGRGAPAFARDALRRAFALLQPNERETLRRCAVFHGAFTLAAAAHVTGLGKVDEVIVTLAEKNLLTIERFQPMRVSMCEGMRTLAAEGLTPPELATFIERHAEFFCERAAAIASGDVETSPVDATEDRDDLRAAMTFGAAHARPDIVLHAALALDVIAFGNGLGQGQLGLLDDALRRGAAVDLSLLGRALLVRSNALYALGRLLEARRDAETALMLATELGDRRRAGAACRCAAQAAFQLGEFDGAREHLARALTIERERGDGLAIAAVHNQLGSLHNSLGELDSARAAFERSLKLARGGGDQSCEALATMGLAWEHFERGERAAALLHYERALVILRRLDMARSERIVIGYIGLLSFAEGDLARAEDHLRRAALASRQAGDLRVEAIFEGVRGGVLASLDRIDEASAAFDLADDLLSRNVFYQGAVRVHRGHLDLAEARAAAASAHPNTALAHVARARWRIEEAHALARRSDDARMAVMILERALAQSPNTIPSG